MSLMSSFNIFCHPSAAKQAVLSSLGQDCRHLLHSLLVAVNHLQNMCEGWCVKLPPHRKNPPLASRNESQRRLGASRRGSGDEKNL